MRVRVVRWDLDGSAATIAGLRDESVAACGAVEGLHRLLDRRGAAFARV